ncbi:DNA primase [Sporosarcina phage Lietuvens]|nr:DNA primase [Sporosarcina phage Lietuvens]
MTIIKVGNELMDVDLEYELRRYDWDRSRWTSDKLIACSPFRGDSNPSFYVNLEGDYAGVFGDSGASDDEYKSGGFVKLLAYLRGESTGETIDYLAAEYGALYTIAPDEPIRLPSIKLAQPATHKAPESVTQAVSPYLTKRGIREDVQRLYGVGYGAGHAGFTALPWHTPDGRLANVKYRSTTGKTFFYESNAVPVNRLVYGLDAVNEAGITEAVLCEGEIDAMSWATAGIHGVAVGGSALSKSQIDAIKRSTLRTLYLGGDNDAMGRRLNKYAKHALQGYVAVGEIDYGGYKDANEVLCAEGSRYLTELSNITVTKLRENSLHLRNIKVK